MDALVAGSDRILVQQITQAAEVVFSFECRNRYKLTDGDGARLGYATEEGDGFGAIVLRNWLGALRAATFTFLDRHGNAVGRAVKPFRLYFHRVDVYDRERKIGAVQRRWAWFNRVYDVENAEGRVVLRVFSPLLRFWTFELRDGTRTIGVIRKKWGGVLRELFTDSDTFGIELPPSTMGTEVRKVLLGATFLIDMVHFENNRPRH